MLISTYIWSKIKNDLFTRMAYLLYNRVECKIALKLYSLLTMLCIMHSKTLTLQFYKSQSFFFSNISYMNEHIN